MTGSKKVDLTAAKQAETEKTKRSRKTSSGTGGSDEVYDVGHDRAERTAAKNDAQETSSQDGSTAATPGEDKGFMERIAEMDTKKLILGRVLPGIVVLGMVFSLGMCAAPKEKEEAAPPQQVDNVEGAYSILEDVESLKDDQIKALRKQIAVLNDEGSEVTQEELAAISMLNDDTSKTLNPFFDAVIGIDPRASESELATHQRNLAQYMTDSASTSTLYNLLSGGSPGREVNAKVTKAGGAMPSWLATSGKDRRTYLVAVPVVTEDGVVKAEYVVSMLDKKIDGIDYLGLLHDETKPLEKVLEDQQKAPIPSTGASNEDESGDAGAAPAEGVSAGVDDTRKDGMPSTKDPNGDCAAGDKAETTTDENGQVSINLC